MSYDNYRPSRFQLLPEVVKNLLIINGIVFFASIVMGQSLGWDLIDQFGLYYYESPKFHWYQFITHLFLHGNFAHIASNMFALWMFGNVLENYWGGKRFLIYYLITGLGAAIFHSLIMMYDFHGLASQIQAYAAAPDFDKFVDLVSKNGLPQEAYGSFNAFLAKWRLLGMDDPNFKLQSIRYANQIYEYKLLNPTVGASGAVFGVLLAFGMLFPNTFIYVYFAIPVKAKYFVIFYGLMELYLGFRNNPGDNVAHFAHLGGMLFGFILLKFWNKRNRLDFY